MALEQIGLAAVLDDKNFQAGLKRYTSGVSQMTSLTDGAAKMLTGAFVAGIGAVTVAASGIVAAAKIGLDATLAWAEQLDKLSDQFGFSGQQASGWAFLMNRVGLTVDEGGQGLNYFTNQLGSFGKTMKDGTLQVTPFSTALSKLGINAVDKTTGKLKTFDQIMPEIMDKFSKLPAGVNASALAMDLFGARGGTKFLDFLRQGSKGLDDAKKKAQDFGLDLSTDEVNAAEEFGFAMNELNLEFTGFKNIIGRAVLPIAKELIRWISANAIPRLIDLARRYVPLLISGLRSLGDWVDRNVLPRLRQFTSWIQTDAIPFIKRLWQAFQTGGLGGVFGELLGDIQKALPGIRTQLGTLATGFWDWLTGPGGALSQAGAKILEFAGELGKAVVENWPAVSAQLATWKDRFWDWLTGKDGAISQAAAKVGEVATKLATWLQNNWDGAIKPTLENWIGLFWEWLTGKGGVIDSIATRMDELFPALNRWLTDPKTAKALEDVGAGIARTIIDGIGKLFSSDQARSDSAMNRLITSLNQARLNLAGGFAGLGANLGIDIGNALSAWLGGPTATGQLRDAIYSWLSAAINALMFENNVPLINKITDWILGKGQTQAPIGPGIGTAGPAFQKGGYVPRDMMARLHAGEYVLPASMVSRTVNNNQRMIGAGAVVINFPAGTTLSKADVEEVTYRAVRRVMNAA